MDDIEDLNSLLKELKHRSEIIYSYKGVGLNMAGPSIWDLREELDWWISQTEAEIDNASN